MAGWGFRFLIPVPAGWAGAGFSPWSIKGRGAGFSRGYNSGLRAEETEHFSSGGRKASGPAPFRTWALRIRHAAATPMNFLNAFSHFSSSISAGPERSGGAQPRVPREGGGGEGWPVRDLLEYHLRGADAGPIQVARGAAQAGGWGRGGDLRGDSYDQGELSGWVGGHVAGRT